MRKKQRAFTLLEIMLVVTIIALLLAAAIKFMAPNVDIAKRVRVAGDIQAIKTSLLAYQGINGFYPTTEQGLQALVVAPSTDPGLPAGNNSWRQFRLILGERPMFTAAPVRRIPPNTICTRPARIGFPIPRTTTRDNSYSSESSGGGTFGVGAAGVGFRWMTPR